MVQSIQRNSFQSSFSIQIEFSWPSVRSFLLSLTSSNSQSSNSFTLSLSSAASSIRNTSSTQRSSPIEQKDEAETQRRSFLNDSCPICMNSIDEDKEIATVDCNHQFHPGCLIKWVEEKAECPFDRSRIESIEVMKHGRIIRKYEIE